MGQRLLAIALGQCQPAGQHHRFHAAGRLLQRLAGLGGCAIQVAYLQRIIALHPAQFSFIWIAIECFVQHPPRLVIAAKPEQGHRAQRMQLRRKLSGRVAGEFKRLFIVVLDQVGTRHQRPDLLGIIGIALQLAKRRLRRQAIAQFDHRPCK